MRCLAKARHHNWISRIARSPASKPVEIANGASESPLQRESESRVLPVTRSIGGLLGDRSLSSPHAILFSETGSSFRSLLDERRRLTLADGSERD